ncbi:hypothetical protein M0R04_11815 [Candidatus Dojkabacteria bacterium]|jgi:hypothetical protein|nr:hypothetical protein [Candidatus Dojkabacteria bacterium]
MPTPFEDSLSGQVPEIPNEEIKQDLEQGIEKDYSAAMQKVRAKNQKKLLKLSFLEKERIAKHIKYLYTQIQAKHQERCSDIDEFDRVYRIEPIALSGADDDTPRYATDLTTVTLEVVHANVMNVFFTPSKIMRVLPTEEGDVKKVNKIDIFGNWSLKNELEIFENCDRMFHASAKNGEAPYMVYWAKEYGSEVVIETIPDPLNPSQPLLDEDGEPMTQERDVVKMLYNGPKLEVFSRKDYLRPLNATADRLPDWEGRIVRLSADRVKRNEDEGKYYEGTFEEIGGWGNTEESNDANNKTDKDGAATPLGKSEKLFIEFYGRLRVEQVKNDDNEEESYEELEDELIGLIEVSSETLCYLKKNRFPLKERPIGLDGFIPDDEGRIDSIGVVEFMEGMQKCYDGLYNQYVFGVVQANNPSGFFTPTGNMKDETIKIKAGYLYPSSDPGSVNMMKISPPDNSLPNLMEEVRNQAQLLFGISDYAAGVESKIDPSAPARKAELVVAQGSTRLNLVIRRKNKTLKDIFRRWFLLYQANMPKNKFMRIAGDTSESPWKFESIKLSDFALKSIPDFELTGNVLNSNKSLEAQKAMGIYQQLFANPFFSPQSQQGLKALHGLTKWFIDKMDDVGLVNFLPPIGPESINTPEEENARFLQGDQLAPVMGQDHVKHIKVHAQMLADQSLPKEIIEYLKKHIQETLVMLKQQVTFQIASTMANQVPLNQAGQVNQGGNPNAGPQGTNPTGGLVQPSGMGNIQ